MRSRTRSSTRPGSERAALGVVAQDFVEPDADAGERRRKVEDLAELPVPADQLQVLVEHRDALAHVIERGLQDFAVVLDRRAGVVEQFQRGLGGHGALAQQQREHEARGGRADRRGENMLGVAQQVDVGFLLGIEADAAARRRSSRTTRRCAPRRDSARPSRSAPRPSPRSATAGSSASSARARAARRCSPAAARSRSGRARARTSHRRSR